MSSQPATTATETTATHKWACPKCGADANSHGKGGAEKCKYDPRGKECQGFICECEDPGDEETHGITLSNPCYEANCYHCGWGGVFPKPPKGAQAWEKKALADGWTPPARRAAELGLCTTGEKR